MTVPSADGVGTLARELTERRGGEVVDLTREFVRQRSPAPKDAPVDVAAAQRWLAERLRSWGCFDEVEIWEQEPGHPNVVAVVRGRTREPGLMFNGHGDVVPVTDGQAAVWDGDPWSGDVRGGRLWGRGAADMKGGVAAAACALRFAVESGMRLERDALLVVNVGEEYVRPDLGIESVLARGHTASLVVSMEPTNLEVCRAAIGWFGFGLRLQGQSIHVASRHEVLYPRTEPGGPTGVDAIGLMRRFLDAFDGLNRRWGLYHHHELAPPGMSNVGPVEILGGAQAAAVPESCEATFVVTVAPGQSAAELVREVRRAVAQVAEGDPWLEAHPPVLTVPALDPIVYEPFEVSESDLAVRALLAASEDALGAAPRQGCMAAPSDANILTTHGLRVLVCGPGRQDAGVHGPNEFVEVDRLLDATKVYLALLARWCGAPES